MRPEHLRLVFRLAAAQTAVAVFCCFQCFGATSSTETTELSDVEKSTPFSTVVRAGDYVLAANANGLYRASVSAKTWQKLASLPNNGATGSFACSQLESNSLYFWSPSSGSKSGQGSLFVTRDAGTTWALLTDKHDFQSVYPHPNGQLYAITMSRSEKSMRWEIVVSDDGGKNWKNITGNIAPGMMLCGIFQDPVNTNRVCLIGNCIRNYVLEASDGSFTNWIPTREWEWRKDSETDEDFLRGGYSTGSTLYMLNARLNNYFDYDFGYAHQIRAFEISTDTNRLVFRPKDKIIIPVTIKFREPGFSVKLPDATNGEEMWGIQMITPSGERIRSEAKVNRVGQAARNEALRQQYRALPDFRIVEVSATNSYSRTIELSRLSDFSKPGEYRFRLWYSSSGWALEQGEHEAHGIKTDIWDGSFCSAIFTLTIKP